MPSSSTSGQGGGKMNQPAEPSKPQGSGGTNMPSSTQGSGSTNMPSNQSR
jgi:hypothetical protein